MVHRRRASAFALAVAVVFSGVLGAQKKDDKKQDEGQRKELAAVQKLADDQVAGTGQAPNDLGLTWVHEDFIKAQGNKEYVPFIVTVDPSKVSGGRLTLYWRVVSKDAAPPAAPPAGKKDDKKDKDKNARPEYAWEDVGYEVPVPAPAGTPGAIGPVRISRAFSVAPGSYDVYIVAKEPASSQKGAPAPKVAALKQTLAVPDYWNGELNTSSVIFAQRMDPLPAPLTPQQQTDRPYALGQMEILPQLELKFSKKAELQPVFFVYNPKLDSAGKPDVVIEYNFYTKTGSAEKFFNHTSPQTYNAQTLPQFDAAAGHQIPGGLAIPLTSFPEGDYRLEIKITDNISKKTLTRDVNFTVTAS
jgi:hypothetical protein